ncbi:septin-7-like isoform X2 [Symphalangus syndactylus]|uniref:septin-7-like isoform X2 n=1 Tax=Symphalangus syndactylus TaxID=9590 RepID=UPI0030049F47
MQNHARTDIRCLITGCSVVFPSLLLQDIDKPLDIEFMKRLHVKVNIIPLIVKADTLTPEECQQFKKQYRLPLAVVGSNTIIEVNGKRVRGRQYPWSVAEAPSAMTRELLVAELRL